MQATAIILGATLSSFMVLTGIAAAGTSLDSIRIEDPRPADRHKVDRYTCAGEDDKATDVVVEYSTTAISPVEHQSRIHRIVIGDRELSAGELDQINEFASAGTVDASSAACSSTGIRVIIDVFDADSIERGDCLTDAHFLVQIHFDRQTGELKLP